VHPSVRNTLIALLVVMTAALVLFIYRVTHPAESLHEELLRYGYFSFDDPTPLTDVNLTDHLGRPFTQEQFKGKKTLVFFGFTTCPDVCPTTLAILNHAMRHTHSLPRVVLISVDPERDTVEKLASYVPAFNPAFIGLTGDLDSITRVATQLNAGFMKSSGDDADSYTVDHSASILLIDEEARYAGFFRMPHQELNIAKALNRLAGESVPSD